ncbi:MAG: amidohydrolase [Polyangiaceae bacterium]|nr:amidohydrolase [Polyangiaceae bacterium]
MIPAASATQVLTNARVRVLDTADTRAEALCWRDGQLVAVGSGPDVLAAAGPGAEAVDVGGATVLPGFVDAHHHGCIAALYGQRLRLRPPEVTDLPSLQRALRSASRELEAGQWLIATDWDELLLAERRAPTRAELDEAVGDRPLMAMHYSCHRLLANSRALELAGIGRHTPDPSGGVISRGRGGLPDGLLIERAMSRVESLARQDALARDAEDFLQRLGKHNRSLTEVGITRVVDTAVPADLGALYRAADARGLLLVPTVMLPVSVSGYLEAPWDVLDGSVTGESEGLLTTGPVKLVFDGAPGCSMCLGWWQSAGATLATFAQCLRQGSLDPVRTMLSVAPRLGRELRSGIDIYRRDEARDIVQAATERGFSLAIHAIGNSAIASALDAYEACGARLHDVGTPRIEHATFLERDAIARVAGLGVTIVAQPHFVTLPAFASAPVIPGLHITPLRWLLDAGVRVAGSSDFPVAGFDPLDGIRGAVRRRTPQGEVKDASQCITLTEALGLYTRGAAEAAGAGAACGTLEPGKRADLVILDGALERESDLDSARVRATVIGGSVVHGRASP